MTGAREEFFLNRAVRKKTETFLHVMLCLIFNSDTPDRYSGEVSGVGINRERARAREKRVGGTKRMYFRGTIGLVRAWRGRRYLRSI